MFRAMACVWRITDFPKNQQFATHRLVIDFSHDVANCRSRLRQSQRPRMAPC